MQLLCLRLSELAGDERLTPGMASLAKMNHAAKARAIVADARDILGGNGILLEHHVARHHADMEAVFTFEGTDSIQSLIVGREITGHPGHRAVARRRLMAAADDLDLLAASLPGTTAKRPRGRAASRRSSSGKSRARRCRRVCRDMRRQTRRSSRWAPAQADATSRRGHPPSVMLLEPYTTLRRWRNGLPPRSSRTTPSTRPSPSRVRPSVTAAMRPRLRLDEARHRLVDRVGGQQVPGGDRVALADAVAAVLGLVVHRRRPLELEEGDVRRARERDALGGDARRAHDELRAVGLLEGARRRRRASGTLSRPSRCSASGKRSMTASWTSMWRAKTTSGSPEARKSWIQASAACELAAGGEALQRAELRQALGAQRRGDAGVELAQVERLLAQPGDDVLLGQPVLALVVERDGDDDLALGGQLGEDLGLQAAHEAAPAQVPVQALLGELAAELAGEARARAEVLEAADDAQLADELLGVVEHGRAGQREAQAVGRRRSRPAGAPPACAWPAGSCTGATRRRRARAGACGRAPRGGRRPPRS